MFEFDEEKVADKLMEEDWGCSREEALRIAKCKHNLHEKLHPAFLTWLNGGIPEFEYEGFTLDYLKQLIRADSYFKAIVQMDIILKDPVKQVPRHRESRNFARM